MGPGRLHSAKCMGCNELQVTLQRNCFGCRRANCMPWSCRPGMWKRGATRVNTGFWFCRAMLPKRMTWLVLDVLLLPRGWRNDLNIIRPSERETKTTWSNKYVRTTICCKLKTFVDALHTRFEHLQKKKALASYRTTMEPICLMKLLSKKICNRKFAQKKWLR